MPIHESSASPRPVAILIVAYRSPALLDQCLQSVRRHLTGREVHIWDNSAPSDEVRGIAGNYPDMRWHFSEENVGFAAAINRLAEQVPAHDLLLLNPDAELIAPLSATLTALRQPRVAATAPMVDDPGHCRWDVAHRRMTFLNAIGTSAGFGERLRGTPLSNLYRRPPDDVDGYLSGACLAISRSAWDSVGPFDEEFFLYGEEADWQQRAVAAGWRIRLAGEVGVRHRAMGTVSGDKPVATRSMDLLRANQALLLERRYGRLSADLFMVWLAMAEMLRRVVYRRRLQPADGFVITVDGSNATVRQRVSLALRLAASGRPVTVVTFDRLGDLPRRLPPPIRLTRAAWWWPSVTPESLPPVLVRGSSPSRRERAFARLFQLRRAGTRVVSAE